MPELRNEYAAHPSRAQRQDVALSGVEGHPHLPDPRTKVANNVKMTEQTHFGREEKTENLMTGFSLQVQAHRECAQETKPISLEKGPKQTEFG